MAQALPRTGFNSSRLVRSLAGLAAPEASESKQSFAERLGQWLDFNDALALFSALNAAADGASAAPSASLSTESAAAKQALARTRAAVAEAMTADGARQPGKPRIEWPAADPDVPADDAPDFAPYHRYYLAHQREMSASIAALRTTVRSALSRRSATLRRLAVLDAVLDQGLAARERELLSKVPALLARRFETLYRATPGEVSADEPQRRMEAGGWLAVFRGDMQAVLRAELELRLQPVVGLIAALDREGARSETGAVGSPARRPQPGAGWPPSG